MLVNQEVVFIIFIFVYEQKFEEYLNLIKKKKRKKKRIEQKFQNLKIDLGVGHFQGLPFLFIWVRICSLTRFFSHNFLKEPIMI